MRYVVSVLLFLMTTVPASPSSGQDQDQIGVYFDTEAEVTCYPEYSGVPIDVYVIITNPAFPDIRGVAFSLCLGFPDGGGEFYTYVTEYRMSSACSRYDVHPVEEYWCLDGLRRGCDPGPSPSSTALEVMSFQIRIFGDFPVDFYLGPFLGPDGEETPVYYWGEELIPQPLGVSSGDLALPVATIAGDCPVPVEAMAFARLKCIYR